MTWLLFLHPVEASEWLLDAAETAFSMVTPASQECLLLSTKQKSDEDADDDLVRDWRDAKCFMIWSEWLGRNESIAGSAPAWIVTKKTERKLNLNSIQLLAWAARLMMR